MCVRRCPMLRELVSMTRLSLGLAKQVHWTFDNGRSAVSQCVTGLLPFIHTLIDIYAEFSIDILMDPAGEPGGFRPTNSAAARRHPDPAWTSTNRPGLWHSRRWLPDYCFQ